MGISDKIIVKRITIDEATIQESFVKISDDCIGIKI